MQPPIHRLVCGLGQERVAGLHLPAANILLAAAVSLKSLSRVGLCFEFHVLENKLAQFNAPMNQKDFASLQKFKAES